MKYFSTNVLKKAFASAMAVTATVAPAIANAQDYDTLIGNTQATIDNLSAEQSQIHAELNHAYAQIEALTAQANELATEVQKDDAQLAELQQEIGKLSEMIDKRESLLEEQARKIQVQAGSNKYLNYIASAKSVSDFVGRAEVVNKMVSANKEVINVQKSDKDDLETKQQQTEATKANRVAKMEELASIHNDIAGYAATQEANYNQLAQAIAGNVEQLNALHAEKAAYEEALRQEAERAAAAQAAVATQAGYEQALAEAQAQDADIQAAQAQVDEAAQAESQAQEAVRAAEAEAQQAQQEIVQPTVELDATAQAEAEQKAAEAAQKAEQARQAASAATEKKVAAQANVDGLLANAAKYIGTPYVWGGKTPSGFDCSGFVQYVYNETYGKNVGNWTGEQQYAGSVIGVNEAQAGDLYLWGTPGGATSHVAIATGNGNYIHASQPGSPLGYGKTAHFTPNFAVRVNLNK